MRSSVCLARTSWTMPTTMFVLMTASETSASKGRPDEDEREAQQEEDVVDEGEDVLADDGRVGAGRRRGRRCCPRPRARRSAASASVRPGRAACRAARCGLASSRLRTRPSTTDTADDAAVIVRRGTRAERRRDGLARRGHPGPPTGVGAVSPPNDERGHRQLDLVDEAGLEERCHERAATLDEEAAARRVGQVREQGLEVDAAGVVDDDLGALRLEPLRWRRGVAPGRRVDPDASRRRPPGSGCCGGSDSGPPGGSMRETAATLIG